MSDKSITIAAAAGRFNAYVPRPATADLFNANLK